MVLKRHFDEEVSDRSSSPTNNKYQKVVKYVMEEAFLQAIAEKIAIRLEPAFRKVVQEELQLYTASCPQSSPRRSLVHQPKSFPSRGLELIFIKKLPPTLFTNTRIEDEDHSTIQVQLVDANSKNVIYNSKLFSMKVEIVVLSGDFLANGGRENWSESEFNDNIVRQREGKRPLLIGDLSIVLVNGVGTLGNVTFTDNSSWIRSRKFKLGVRAVSSASAGTGIKEAVSEAFVVLDHRGESYQKHSKPSLDDPVWRLRKISKLGASHKKLESHGIKTVKDFLIHYHMNPSSLRHVLGKNVANRAWDTMVRHANECHLDNTYSRYYGESESVHLLFNCVYKVIAVKFTDHDYQTVDSLDTRQKALVEKLKQSAFLNLKELVPVYSSSDISPLEQPTIGHSFPFSSPQLDLLHDGFSMIDQDKPEKQLDFNLSDTASYPCTAEEHCVPEEDSASQTDQPIPIHGYSHSQHAFMTGGSSSSIPSDSFYNWHLNSPGTTYAHISPFGDLSHPQTTSWGNDDDLYTILPPAARYGIPFHMPDYGVNTSGNGSPKAGWCKIRAAVMWKIVRRDAAARRKAKFSFS